MTEIDLDALEALANAATPGPWELTDFNEGEDPPRPLWGVVNPPYYNPLDHPDEEAAEVQVHVGGREDAEFIAAARKALPELIAEVRQLREQVAKADQDRDERRADATRHAATILARPIVPETEDGIVVDGSCWCRHALGDHNGNGCTVVDLHFWNGRCQCIVSTATLTRKIQESASRSSQGEGGDPK